MQNAVKNAAIVKRSLPKIMKLNRYTQRGLAKDMAYSEGMVSKWANGKLPLRFEEFEKMIGLFKKPSMLVYEFMNKVTNLIPSIANGPKFRKEPDSTASQLVQEINEALLALNEASDEFRYEGKVEDLSDPKEVINQCLDVELLIHTLEIIIEEKFDGVSIQELEIQREKLWKLQGYIQSEVK